MLTNLEEYKDMRNRLGIYLVALVWLTTALASASAQKRDHIRDRDDSDLPERDEINQSIQLSAGARVEVKGINGTVDIETGESSTAEVHIIRSARTREELNFRKVFVEHTGSSLVVRGDNEKQNWRDHERAEVRQRVMLTLPRRVDL